MLQVKNETIPSTLAVWVTRDSHKCVGHRVQVLNQILKARDKAFKEASNAHDHSIPSGFALGSIDKSVNHNFENENNGVKEGSKGNGTRMLEVSNGHTSYNASRSRLISVGREVELSGRDHVHELGLFTDEHKDPDDAEEHSNSHESSSAGEVDDFVVLVAIWIVLNSDVAHRNHTNQAEAPNEDCDETDKEVVNGN